MTSMNLYEYSQLYNDEMGILVSREDDRELYEAIYNQAMEWKEDSSGVDAPASGRRNARAARTRKEATQTVDAPLKGFCIRCKADVPANLTKPHCSNCYATWNKFKNKKFEEKYCHICGSEHTTTLAEPLCLTCYRELEDVREFIAF